MFKYLLKEYLDWVLYVSDADISKQFLYTWNTVY